MCLKEVIKLNIGQKIKEHRKTKGITREKLAETIGLSVHAIAKYEQGQREVSFEIMDKIALALDVPMSEFLGIREDNINLLSNEFIDQSLKNYPPETKRKVMDIVDLLVLSPYDDILDIDVFEDTDIARFYLTTHIVLALQEYKSDLMKFNYLSNSEKSKLKEILDDNEYPKQDIHLHRLMIDHQKKLLDAKTDIHNAINAFEQWFLDESDKSQDEIYSKDIIDRLEKHVVKYDKKRIDI